MSFARPSEGKSWAFLPWLVLALMILAFAAGFSWLSVLRHEAFQSHAFDLGNMDQAAWNTIQGRPLRFTDMAVGRYVLTDRLAIHVEPLLLLVSWLYLIHAGPETLLVTQACVVALGAIPAYLLARNCRTGGWVALTLPLAYLLHPSLQNAVLDDFHPVTLSACLLLWAIYFTWTGKFLPFIIAGVLAMATKEDIGLLVGLLGLVFIARGSFRTGTAALVLGFGWFFVCVLLIIPHFNPQGHSPYLARYGYLGHGLTGMVRGVVRHPGRVLAVLTSAPRQAFIRDLFGPLGFASILGWPVVIFAAPSLAIDMLSADPTMYSGYYQYAAEVVPYVVAAAALGLVWISNLSIVRRSARGSLMPVVLSALITAASLLGAYLDGFSPFAYGYTTPSAGDHQRLETGLLRVIPQRAIVAAADEIEPHLSDRRTIYLLPTVHPRNGPFAQYIVLDASIPSLPVTPRALHDVVTAALSGGYGVLRATDGVLVLERGMRRRQLPANFYRFVFAPPSHAAPASASWGSLRLSAVVVHPGNRYINRARPAVSLETYWRTTKRLPRGVRIQFYISQPYTGAHPSFSHRWQASGDSPTWDWLPLRAWPSGVEIHAASLPLLPDVSRPARVDVGVAVIGLGPARGVTGSAVRGNRDMVRVGTIQIGN